MKTEKTQLRPLINKHTETLVYASKKVDLEVNIKKTKYMLVSHYQNADQTQDIIETRSSENVSQFTYVGTTATNQNVIQEESKRRLNSGNACYHLVQNFLSSHLLSKSLKIGLYKIIILPVVL
jgi:HSP90 family molecular chaperone